MMRLEQEGLILKTGKNGERTLDRLLDARDEGRDPDSGMRPDPAEETREGRMKRKRKALAAATVSAEPEGSERIST